MIYPSYSRKINYPNLNLSNSFNKNNYSYITIRFFEEVKETDHSVRGFRQEKKTNTSHTSLDYMSSYAKEYQLLKADIDEFLLLESNWNDNQAESFDNNIILNAKSFLEFIKELSNDISVFPTARKSIQFEYEHKDVYCEAEIFIDNVTIFATNRRNRKIRKNINGYEYIENSSNLFKRIFDGCWE